MDKVKNWVTASEVEALRKAARKTRNPARNELIILMLYRHGLRVSELCLIKLEQLNLDQATVFVKRSKNGIDGMHPIAGDELRLLRRYLRERETELPWLFICLDHRTGWVPILTVEARHHLQKIPPLLTSS